MQFTNQIVQELIISSATGQPAVQIGPGPQIDLYDNTGKLIAMLDHNFLTLYDTDGTSVIGALNRSGLTVTNNHTVQGAAIKLIPYNPATLSAALEFDSGAVGAIYPIDILAGFTGTAGSQRQFVEIVTGGFSANTGIDIIAASPSADGNTSDYWSIVGQNFVVELLNESTPNVPATPSKFFIGDTITRPATPSYFITNCTFVAEDPGLFGTNTGETWHAVTTYANGWTGDAAYRLMPDGTVMLAGTASGGTAPSAGLTVFTLPVGYRPSAHGAGERSVARPTSYVTAKVDVQTNGNVIYWANDAVPHISFAGIRFALPSMG